jgi:uncharacterized protein
MRPLFLLTISLLITCFTSAQQKQSTSNTKRSLPKPVGAVNDFGLFLTAQERETLENELVRYQKATTNTIVIATLKELPLEPGTQKKSTIEKTAFQYFNAWGIGDSIKNNGVLIMLSKNDRQVRIEVGKGLEKILTNSVCAQIIAQQIVPHFKKEAYYTGLNEAIQALKKQLGNKSLTATHTTNKATQDFRLIDHSLKLQPQKQGSLAALFVVLALIAVGIGLFGLLGRRSAAGTASNNNDMDELQRRQIQNDYLNQQIMMNSAMLSTGIDTTPDTPAANDTSTPGSVDSGSFDGGSTSGGGSDGSW